MSTRARCGRLRHALPALALGALLGCGHAAVKLGPLAEAAAAAKKGQELLAEGKLEEARAGFEDALARDPASLPALRGRVETSRRLGRLPDVAQAAEQLAATRPAWMPAHYQLGLVRFAQGDEQAALAAFRRAVELSPGEADVHYRLGLVLFDGEKFAEARGPLARAVELGPKVARYRMPLATCLDRLGERKAAVAQLAVIPKLGPTPEEAALAVKVSRTITDPFRGVPPGAKAELEQGLGYLLRDAAGLAVPALEAVVLKFPELGAAHALLGLAAQRLDESGRAVTELLRAAELSPDAPQPHAYLGELYAGKERPELAARAFEAALARDPLDVPTLRKLGVLRLERLNAPAAALEPLQTAVALAPQDLPLQLLTARAELAGGQARAGRERLEALEEKQPDDPEVLLRLALALFEEQKAATGDARTALVRRIQGLAEKVLSLQPENATAGRLLQAVKAG